MCCRAWTAASACCSTPPRADYARGRRARSTLSRLRTFERGAAMTEDLSEHGWDPWKYFERPLAEVRDELNVPAR